MSQLDEKLRKIITNGDGVFGVAMIEINTRKLVSSALLSNDLSSGTLDAIAVSAVEMVRGKAVSAIESLTASQLNMPIEQSIEDVCINTKNARIFLAVLPGKPDFLMALGTDLSINTAMGWVLVRRNMTEIAEALS